MIKEQESDKEKVEHLNSDLEAVAAHQLKVPLARNKWGLSYVLRGSLGEVPPLQKEVLQSVFENNERAIGIANDILMAQGIESDIAQALQVIDLGSLVQKVQSEFAPEASAKKITLSFNQDSSYRVSATEDKLSYVFENIIGDALQYTQEGGRISIALLEQGHDVVVSISDTGIGIPDEEQEQIFGKFFRAKNARQHDSDGTGLGLYVSKKIVESFGGKVWFSSKEGEGTTFSISFPLVEEV